MKRDNDSDGLGARPGGITKCRKTPISFVCRVESTTNRPGTTLDHGFLDDCRNVGRGTRMALRSAFVIKRNVSSS